jgi:hypothetical protein
VVERQALVLVGGKLALGDARRERIVRQVQGHGFVDHANAGDCVSTHWDWMCEVLTEAQRRNLERYTRQHLAIANQTL